MKKVNLLSRTDMKWVIGGTEPSDDDSEVVCRECETDANCTGERKCKDVNKTCDGGKTMTRCMIPAFE